METQYRHPSSHQSTRGSFTRTSTEGVSYLLSYTQWRETNLPGDIKASFKVATACLMMMPSRFVRA